jgi:prepilin-type N-terminal cleavage/methylation domain-containing protein
MVRIRFPSRIYVLPSDGDSPIIETQPPPDGRIRTKSERNVTVSEAPVPAARKLRSDRCRLTARGMSLVEILAVVAIIAVLIAILLPGLAVVRRNAIWANSQSNLRNVHTFLAAYAQANRETIIPTGFDFTAQAADPRVRVRTPSPQGTTMPVGAERVGSWTDIMWMDAKLGPFVNLSMDDEGTGQLSNYDYAYDSPDRVFYERNEGYSGNVLRSAAENTNFAGNSTSEAWPFGTGSREIEKAQPGYFAGNPFFDLRPNGFNPGKWWSTGQIVRPVQSVYCVDSYGGEVFPVVGNATDPNSFAIPNVDYRYVGNVCLMLFLDGHVASESEFETLRELEEERQVRMLDLDQRRPFYGVSP